MSAPTFTQLALKLSKTVALPEKVRRAALVQTDNFNTHQDSLEQNYIGDYTSELADAVGSYRSAFAATLDDDGIKRLLDPTIKDFGKLINTPFSDPLAILPELRKWFVANAHAIKSPSPTIATPAQGAGVNGKMYRLSVDEDGFPLLMQWFDAKVVECVADETSGAQKHEAVFAIKSSTGGLDRAMEIGHNGDPGGIVAMSARSSLAYISNPSFSSVEPDDVDGATLTADPSGWTNESGGTFTSLKTYTSDFYRDFTGDPTPRSLELTANTSYYQLVSTLDPALPVYLQFAIKRKNSADGTFTVSLQPFAGGGTSVAVTVSTLTNDLWYVFQLPLNKFLWYKNFNGQQVVVRWAWSGRTTGEIRYDDITFGPFTPYDGDWYAVVDSRNVGTSGAPDPFLYLEQFTIADSVGVTSAIVWRWLYRAYGSLGQLPSDPAVFDVPEPTVT